MSARFDASGDHLSRSTGLPGIPLTMMGHFYLVSDRNTWQNFFYYGKTPPDSGLYYVVQTTADGLTLTSYNGDSSVDGPALSVGTWFHLAFTIAGTGAGQFLTYLNGALTITHAGSTTPLLQILEVGNDPPGEWMDARVSNLLVYTRVLSPEEIDAQRRCFLPLSGVSLYGWYPEPQTGLDWSTNGNHWTVSGTLGVEDNPPIGWQARRPFRRTGRRLFMAG